MVVRTHNYSGIPWYGHEKDELVNKIEWSFKHRIGPGQLPGPQVPKAKFARLLGIVSPHAGYSYSGPHACHGFLELSKYNEIDTVIVLGTNHTGMGYPTSLFPLGEWQTPLGSIQIDEEIHKQFTDLIRPNAKKIGFGVDSDAHFTEHSIDNQLPFLQYTIKNAFKILPITMGDHSLITCNIVANALSKIISSTEKHIVIVASSDFTHYLSPAEAEKKDKPVIGFLQSYKIEEAVTSKKQSNASICGFGPVITLFLVAKQLNMLKNELLKYGNSGETGGDFSSVVAYASIILGT